MEKERDVGGFTRFLYIFYFVVSVLTVGILAASWFGIAPISEYADAFLALPWAHWVILGGLAVVAVGLIVILAKAIFTRGKRSSQVSHTALGEVRITRRMFEDVVEEVVGRYHGLEFDDVDVKITNGSNPSSAIEVTVVPHEIDTLSASAERLQADIKHEIEALTGNTVSGVCVNFKAGAAAPRKIANAETAGATSTQHTTSETNGDTVPLGTNAADDMQ